MIAEASFGIVKLMGAYAQIKKYTIHFINSETVKHFRYIGKIRMYNRCARIFCEAFRCRLYRIGIFIEGDKLSVRKTFCYFGRMSCSAGGSVNVYPVRFDIEPLYAFVEKHRYMLKIHFAHTVPQNPSSSIASAIESELIAPLLSIQRSLSQTST